MKHRLQLLVITICLLGVAGCATADSDTRQSKETQKAVEVLGGRDRFAQFIVPSRGSILDGMVSGMSVAAPSALSRDLAEQLREVKGRGLHMVISGPDEFKTRISFMKAIGLIADGELAGIKILFFGRGADSDALDAKVKRTGAEFLYFDKDSLK
jgi:hypothetical protein